MSAAGAILALPVSALVIWTLLRTSFGRQLVAEPTADRWHDRITPTFGGVGIFLGLVAGVTLAWAIGGVDGSAELGGIVGGAALLFVAGLVDDVKSLPPLAKIGAQVGAAALVLGSGLRVEIVDNGVLAALLGGVWIVGMTNAFNLLDNMDGLAGTLGAIAATFFAIDAVTIHPERLLLVVALGLALALLGFLPFNFRPRKPAATFMGDSGSQVIGFVLAALALETSWKVAESTVATLILPLLVLAVPLLDTALVTAVRIVEGRPVTQGGRDHTSHRLVRGGLTEKRTVVLLGAIAAGLGTTSLAYTVLGNWRVTLVGVLVTFALLVQFAGFLTDIDQGYAEPGGRDVLLRRIIFSPRRLAELAIDFALTTAAFGFAYLLFTTGDGTDYQKHVFLVSLPALLGARAACFLPFGLYSGVWRFAGAREAVAVVSATVLSELVAVGIVWASIGNFGDFRLGIYVVDCVLATALVGASRFGERALFRVLSTLRDRDLRRRTLIVGAGRSGRSLLRELRESPGTQIVGFVDDDPKLRRRRLQGVPVLGGSGEIERVIERTHPDVVLVTIPDAPRDTLDGVVRGCDRAGVPCRFVRREIDLDPVAVMGVVVH